MHLQKGMIRLLYTSLWKGRPTNPTTELLLAVSFHSPLMQRATGVVVLVASTCIAARREAW